MPYHASRLVPWIALALVAACQRGERPSATTGGADSGGVRNWELVGG